MFFNLLFIIIILFSSIIHSQRTNDIAKVDSLLEEGFDLRWINPKESILMISKALELSKEIDYPTGICKSYSFMGVAYENLSMYDKALESYLTGLRISDSLNLSQDHGFAYNNIANYYIHLNKIDLALENLKNAEKIGLKINDPVLLGYIYKNFSYLYRTQKNFDLALNYAKKSLELREKLNNESGIISSLRELLVIYFKSGDYRNAELILNRLYTIIGSNQKYKLQLARIKRTQSEMLMKQNNFSKAISVFDESLSIFKEINNLEGIIRIYRLKSELYSSIGKYKDAFESIIQQNAYQDSLNNFISAQKIALLEIELRNKELKNELELASEEIKLRNTILISLFIGFLILGTSVYFAQKANKQKRKLINQISDQNLILEKDIRNKQKLLSIIGHDVKNPLSSVYSISEYLINDFDSIDENELRHYLNIIHQAIKNSLSLLDNLLLWSMNKLGMLKIEFKEVNIKNLVEEVLALYDSNIREKNIAVLKNLDAEKALADQNMLSAILRNLINNAIKFSNNDGIIRIESENVENKILIKIIDSGKGLTKEKIESILSSDEINLSQASKSESSTGLGLQIVKEFVKILNGTFDIKSEINKETEFSFTLMKSSN